MKTKLIIDALGVTIVNSTIKEFLPFFSESLKFYTDYINNEYVEILEDGTMTSTISNAEKIGDEVILDYDKSFIICKSNRIEIIGYSSLVETNTNISRLVEDVNDSFKSKELTYFIINKLWNK